MNDTGALPVAEDFEFWLRLAKNYLLAGIHRPLAFYRLRESNLLGDGRQIEHELKYSLTALLEFEKRYPEVWVECEVEKELLFARLHIRAGFAWKRRGDWRQCWRQYHAALKESYRPRVWRWLAAATVLPRWS